MITSCFEDTPIPLCLCCFRPPFHNEGLDLWSVHLVLKAPNFNIFWLLFGWPPLLRIGAWICDNVALFWTSQIPLWLCCFSTAFSQWGLGFVERSPCLKAPNSNLFWLLFGWPPLLRIGAWICDNVALFWTSQIPLWLCCFSTAFSQWGLGFVERSPCLKVPNSNLFWLLFGRPLC